MAGWNFSIQPPMAKRFEVSARTGEDTDSSTTSAATDFIECLRSPMAVRNVNFLSSGGKAIANDNREA